MSSFGKIFKVTTYGESHGSSIGCIVENFPSNQHIDLEFIQNQLNRRKPGVSIINSKRKEEDIVEIHSGIENGRSLGTPIFLIIKNKDFIFEDYKNIKDIPRPGHADLTYLSKYGIKCLSGGGRSSARETVARVAAGSLAEKFLIDKFKINIFSFVKVIGRCKISQAVDYYIDKKYSKEIIDKLGSFHIYIEKGKSIQTELKLGNLIYYNEYLESIFIIIDSNSEEINIKSNQFLYYMKKHWNVSINDSKIELILKGSECNEEVIFEYFDFSNIRCIEPKIGVLMIQEILIHKYNNDSIGGVITCVIENVPRSLGEPCFDKIEALLAQAMLSIPSTKGFEIGRGFEGVEIKGSEYNDCFRKSKKEDKNLSLSIEKINIEQLTNNSGGTIGGITSGETLYFNILFKPVSTIGREQISSDYQGNEILLENKGRHDPCVLNRAIPIIESMSSIVLMDMIMIQNSRIFK